MELKYMTDQELAQRMVDYIDRVVSLQKKISDYRSGTDVSNENKTRIQNEYSALKKAISADEKYVSSEKNSFGSSEYTDFFIPSIKECISKGFKAPTNSGVNLNMQSAIYDAVFYLTYYHDRDEWVRSANAG